MNRAPTKVGRPAMIESLEPRTLLSSYVVDTPLDETGSNGTTSLREAIVLANANAGPDSITFEGLLAGATIALSGTALSITDDLNISGLGASSLSISGSNTSRIFGITVDNVSVQLSGLTLTAGLSTLGGAILNNGGTLTVSGCVISGNSGGIGFGGGIANVANGTLNLVNSSVTGNTATFGAGISSDACTISISGSVLGANNSSDGLGGALYAIGGSVAVSNSTIEGSSSPYGGGIFVSGATLAVIGSTFNGNSAVSGAGLFAYNSTSTITSSTFSGNAASSRGGAIFNGGGSLLLTNSTLSANTAATSGGGVEVESGAVTLVSSILALNIQGSTPSDITGSVAVGSTHNLIGDAATAGGLVNGANANVVGVDPLLAPLANNGGSTRTHALLPGSPAMNTGSNPSGLAIDQRGAGFPRTRGNAIDIGSFEYAVAPTMGTLSATPAVAVRDQPVALTAGAIADGDGSIARVDFYRDANSNGIADPQELLGSDSNGADGYALNFAANASVAAGPITFLAIAVDNDLLQSAVRTASITLQAIPVIGQFQATPVNTLRGDTVTLTTADVTDEDGSVVRVDFYRDANHNGSPDIGELIGSDSTGLDGFSLAYVPDNSVPQGVLTFITIAVDSDAHSSLARTTNVAFGAIPTIGLFAATPFSVIRGESSTLAATDVSDADGSVIRVDFYRDLNHNGVAETEELIGSDNDGSNGYALAFVADANTSIGQVSFLAVAVDSDGLSSAPTPTSLTLRAIAPTIESLASTSASFGPGDAITLTASNVSDADGSVTGVAFYADLNHNGLAEAGELLGIDTSQADGYSLSLGANQTLTLPEGNLAFLAVATDQDGVLSIPSQANVTLLFSVRAGSEHTLSGAARSEDNQHFIATINNSGHPLVFEAGAPWTAIDLADSIGAPTAISDISFWVDPKDGLVYGAYASTSGLILVSRAANAAWSYRNLTTEFGAASSPTGRLVQFISTGGVVVIAGTTSNGSVVAFEQTLSLNASSQPEFRFVDISGDIGSQGMQTPQFVSMTSFVTAWNTWHLVGIDQGGKIQSVWIDPASFSQWRSDNLSDQYGAPSVQGQLAVTLTPWGGINLTAADASGHLQVTWWVPGSPWLSADLTASTGGAAFSGGHITGYGTPWGGMNYIGVDEGGQVVGYWWAPDTDRWNAGPFLPPNISDAHLPTGELTSYSSPAGTLNVFGTSNIGDALQLWWEPGMEAWNVDDLSEIAVRG